MRIKNRKSHRVNKMRTVEFNKHMVNSYNLYVEYNLISRIDADKQLLAIRQYCNGTGPEPVRGKWFEEATTPMHFTGYNGEMESFILEDTSPEYQEYIATLRNPNN